MCRVILLIFAILISSTCPAQEKIYKWTDASGKVHFSNSPLVENQQEAQLPVIERENLGQKIQRIKQNTPANCEKHGGLDCAQGKDPIDGSVVCLDGFRDAIMPFDFNCLEAKLAATTKVSEEKDIATIEVSLRNESPIKAINIKVKYKLEAFRNIEVELTGPIDIEPYGLENYIFISKDKLDKRYPDRAIIGKSMVKCANCSAVRNVKK